MYTFKTKLEGTTSGYLSAEVELFISLYTLGCDRDVFEVCSIIMEEIGAF